MPYIKQVERSYFEQVARTGGFGLIAGSGQLNYKITTLAIEYVKQQGLSYATINDVIGALEGAKMEFYRRVAAPYENDAIERNGDVYPKELMK
jgi:hypothetical protein